MLKRIIKKLVLKRHFVLLRCGFALSCWLCFLFRRKGFLTKTKYRSTSKRKAKIKIIHQTKYNNNKGNVYWFNMLLFALYFDRFQTDNCECGSTIKWIAVHLSNKQQRNIANLLRVSEQEFSFTFLSDCGHWSLKEMRRNLKQNLYSAIWHIDSALRLREQNSVD